MPKLGYISDIHLEYRAKIPIIRQNNLNYLALIGDIGNPFQKNYSEFLKNISGEFDKIFLISGNHEYWQDKYNYQEVNHQINNICSKFNNIYFLNNKIYKLNNYNILGTTLWSRISNNNNNMGDYKYISPENINILYNNSIKFLENSMDKNKQNIILSHFLPSYKLIEAKYRVGYYKKYHDNFASDLEYLFDPDIIKYWLCGHSHSILNMEINGIYCGINAPGPAKLINQIPWVDLG